MSQTASMSTHVHVCVYVHARVVKRVLEGLVSLQGVFLQAATGDERCQSGEGGSVPRGL